MNYSVVTEPWIPILTASGELQEMGLRDVLCQAHTLRGVQDPAPTVEFGIYRLLTAFVLDIFEPDSTADLTDLLEAGAFDPAAVDAYFVRYADRFDLFHPQFPFLQTGGMAADAAKPLAGLLPFLPSGTAASHFYHAPEADFGVSPAVAARLLTMQAPFMTAGGAGLSPSLNGAPPWYVLLGGRTLFETLCLNVPVDPYLPQNLTKTPPAWRNDQPPAGDRCTRTSLAEALTWRPRRIQLLPGGPGRCTLTGRETQTRIQTMKFTSGASCALETWRDPAAAYRLKDGALIVRPQEGKAVWRDTGPLALLHAGTHGKGEGSVQYERPRLIDQFAEMSKGKWWSGQTDLRLTVYGMRTDLKMKVFEWQCETLSLPVPLIVQSAFGRDAQIAIENANTVASGLRAALKKAYERGGAGNAQAFDERIEAARRQFWAALRGEYETYLVDLAVLSPEADAPQIAALCTGWQATVTRIGRSAFEEAIRDLDTDAQTLKRRVEARQEFGKRLFFAFATPDQRKPKKVKQKVKEKTKQAAGGTL